MAEQPAPHVPPDADIRSTAGLRGHAIPLDNRIPGGRDPGLTATPAAAEPPSPDAAAVPEADGPRSRPPHSGEAAREWLAWAPDIPDMLMCRSTDPTDAVATPYRVVNLRPWTGCRNAARRHFDRKDVPWCRRAAGQGSTSENPPAGTGIRSTDRGQPP